MASVQGDNNAGDDGVLASIIDSWRERRAGIRNIHFVLDEEHVIPRGAQNAVEEEDGSGPMPADDIHMSTRREIWIDLEAGRYLRKHSYPIWNNHYRVYRKAYQEVYCDGKELSIYRPTEKNLDDQTPRSEFQPELVEPVNEVNLKSVLQVDEIPILFSLGLFLDYDNRWISDQSRDGSPNPDVFSLSPRRSNELNAARHRIFVDRNERNSPFLTYDVSITPPYLVLGFIESFPRARKEIEISYDVDSNALASWTKRTIFNDKLMRISKFIVTSMELNQSLDESLWQFQPRRAMWVLNGNDFYKQDSDGTRSGPIRMHELESYKANSDNEAAKSQLLYLTIAIVVILAIAVVIRRFRGNA